MKNRKIYISVILVICIILSFCMVSCRNTSKTESVDSTVVIPTYTNLASGKSVTVNGIINSALTDGNKTTSALSDLQNNTLLLNLGQQCNFSEVHLYETGNKMISKFQIWIKKGNEWAMIYQQDEIGTHRLCSFDPVTTQEVKIEILGNRGTYNLTEIEVVNGKKYSYSQPFRVTSYLTGYSECTFYGAEDLPDFFGSCTDLIYIGDVAWTDTGSLVYGGVVANETEFGEKIANIKQAMSTIKDHIIRLYVTIAPPKTGVAKSLKGSIKDNLIKNLIAFAKKYKLSGLDFDWEYPKSVSEWNIYSIFLTDLKREMSQEGLKLSVALAPWGVNLSSDAVKSIDYVQTMLYDIPDGDTGNHASYQLCDKSLSYFTNLGFEKNQLNMGLAFYGVKNGAQMGYWSVLRYGVSRWDNMTDSGLCYNGPQLIRDKTVLAIQNGWGGVMSWHLYCDAEQSTGVSLSYEVQKAMRDYIK